MATTVPELEFRVVKSRPFCAKKCSNATVTNLFEKRGKKKDPIASWHWCGCVERLPPTNIEEAWTRFSAGECSKSAGRRRRRAKKRLRQAQVPVAQRFERSINCLWLTALLVRSWLIAIIRAVPSFLQQRLNGWLQSAPISQDELIRLAFVGDGILHAAVSLVINENDQLFRCRGYRSKFVSAYHLARVGLRIDLVRQLDLNPEVLANVKQSLEQFDDPCLNHKSLRYVSEIVEALIGQTYERFGYEAAAAFVREQIVLPYLDAQFCTSPKTKTEQLPMLAMVAA